MSFGFELPMLISEWQHMNPFLPSPHMRSHEKQRVSGHYDPMGCGSLNAHRGGGSRRVSERVGSLAKTGGERQQHESDTSHKIWERILEMAPILNKEEKSPTLLTSLHPRLPCQERVI